MNDLINEKYMTIKEISEVVGCSQENVRLKVRQLYPEKVSNGRQTKLNESESYDVVGELRAEIKRNVLPTKNLEVVTKSDLKDFAKEIVSETMKQLLPLIGNQKQIAVEQDYYSILAYAKVKKISNITFSEKITLGKKATKLSKDNDIEIRKIPDERWGEVGSYHISILEEVFND